MQISFIAWCRLFRDERQMAFHIPNEGKRTPLGHIVAVRKGLLPGVSDNLIPAARGGWNGLFVELKRKGAKLTTDQAAFGRSIEACGYRFAWADSIDKAQALVTRYMDGKDARPNWVHYAAPAQ